MRTLHLIIVLFTLFIIAIACGKDPTLDPPTQSNDPAHDGLTRDAATGIPIVATFQHPLPGFDTSDYGFGFGSVNDAFCLPISGGGCEQQLHLARDTVVAKTPVGTNVFAPADGVVRITTDIRFGAFGSDSSANASYNGCAIVLEHLLQNGQAVTTILGHLVCEAGTSYVPSSRRGNPPVGSLVARGQYVGHVGHYWHGPDQSRDWHHLHWGMRKGRFQASGYTRTALGPYIRGYAPRSEFRTDSTTGALVHPEWLDPFLVVQANGDPVAQADASVRHHPSGTLIRAPDGAHWSVMDDVTIAPVSTDVIVTDRYDLSSAVAATQEEIDCHHHATPVEPLGHVTLYVRPGTNTVVMAYDQSWTRYDVIRWEAFVSWGFGDLDIPDLVSGSFYESSYQDRGFRRMRPGSFVKADNASEVAIVTIDGKRLPIASGDVFERAGFQWDRVISLPYSVLDQVAGPRENRTFTISDLTRCAVPPDCPGGGTSCGGGSAAVCVPGERFACMCTEAAVGEQSCADDGLSFLPCTCSSTEGGSGGAPSEDVGSGGVPDPPNGGVGGSAGQDPEEPPPVSSGGIDASLPEGGSGGVETPLETSGGTMASGGVLSFSGGQSSSGGTISSTGGMTGSGGQVLPPVSSAALRLLYQAPVGGPFQIMGWWEAPDGVNRSWEVIPCPDADSSDDQLECDLPVPAGSPVFEFQIYLPDERYWGDHSCGPKGGCDQPIGSVTLTSAGMDVPVTFVPNPEGAPYYNGQVAPVP